MIGTVLGIITAVIWNLFFRKFWLPKESTDDFRALSKDELKKNYPDYTIKARASFPFFFIFAFLQFLIFAFWLFFILERIRPQITESFEANLVGFLFFQSMIINLTFGFGIYGFFFKIFPVSKRGVGFEELERLGLESGLSHFYIIGEGVKKMSVKLISIFLIYYLIIHSTLLLIWS